jgi:hypothetical protein
VCAAETGGLRHACFAISSGDSRRNKNYRASLFGSKKPDPIEARDAARFAIAERPRPHMTAQLRTLRQVADRLQATVRQRPRLIKQ